METEEYTKAEEKKPRFYGVNISKNDGYFSTSFVDRHFSYNVRSTRKCFKPVSSALCSTIMREVRYIVRKMDMGVK